MFGLKPFFFNLLTRPKGRGNTEARGNTEGQNNTEGRGDKHLNLTGLKYISIGSKHICFSRL